MTIPLFSFKISNLQCFHYKNDERLVFSMNCTKPSEFMGLHNEFGKKGEQIATDYLLKNGYSIKYKNYRYLKAEIDIIAQKGSTLAIVEVRSRSTDFIENIADTITKKKIQLQVLAADHYVTDLDLDVEVRFDVITILKNKSTFDLNHIENAYYHF